MLDIKKIKLLEGLNPLSITCLIFALLFVYLIGVSLKDFIGLSEYHALRSIYPHEEKLFPTFNMVALLLILLIMYTLSFLAARFFELKSAGITSYILILLASVALQTYDMDRKEYVLNKMKLNYDMILKIDPKYSKSDNAKKLTKAIAENNPNDYINVLKDKYDNMQFSNQKIKQIFEIVMKVTPENEGLLMSYLKDDYLTVNEYNKLKNKIIKDIEGKELNIKQRSLLYDIN